MSFRSLCSVAAFPPPSDNRFWTQSAIVELDARGHGQVTRESKDAQGFVQSTASYDVTVDNGVARVRYASVLHPATCNSYDETCAFSVLAP